MILDVLSPGGIGRGAQRMAVPAEQVLIRNIDSCVIAVAFTVGDTITVIKHGEPGFAEAAARLNFPVPKLIQLKSK